MSAPEPEASTLRAAVQRWLGRWEDANDEWAPEEMRADMRRVLAASEADRATAGEREHLGRLVREVWVEWAREQPNPKPSWLVAWDDLPEPDREVDRRIGERLAAEGRRPATPPADNASSDASEPLTEAEREIARAADPFGLPLSTSERAAIEGIVAARETKARAEGAAARLGVEAVTVCPHDGGGRHYYALNATCQRCEMPSWIEAAVREAMNRDES